ncbi:MAG TPA: hypothetical protein PKJ62_03790 [Bacteroidia bacterium]|nr:hypothetical protein [Bacteroidia bacterium]HNS12790.1 hypothetical protein [Bacteroidia bacterium]
MNYSEQAPREQESLELIHKMITAAKRDIENDSFHYLLWGWLVFIACVLQFSLMKMNLSLNYIGWMILMPAGSIASMIYGYKQGKRRRIKTYTDEVIKYVLISFLVTLFTVLIFMPRLGLMTYPLIMMIYGLWLFTSGGIIQFRPLIIGGVLNWVLGITSVFLHFEFQLIMLALAVLLGYIVPGYMLRNKFKAYRVS